MIKLTPAFIFLIGFFAFPAFAQLNKKVTPLNSPYPAPTEVGGALGLTGKVAVKITVGKQGEILKTEILESSDLCFSQAALKAAQKMKFNPAIKNGKPVVSYVRQPYIFVRPKYSGVWFKGKPTIPLYSSDSSRTGQVGAAAVKVTLDHVGKPLSYDVLKSTGKVFTAAALKLAKEMEFDPFESDSKSIDGAVYLPFVFSLTPNSNPDRQERVIKSTLPDYPMMARIKKLNWGKVTLEMTIDKAGKVQSVRILNASDPFFSVASVKAAKRMRFQPAVKNGQPIISTRSESFSFKLNDRTRLVNP